MEPAQITAIIAIITAGVGIFTLIKGLREYSMQGAQKRVDLFLEMRKRFKENADFKKMIILIATDNDELTTIDLREKYNYLGFFDEIAIMVNSGLIRKEVALYTFGYDVLQCWYSKKFWSNVRRDSLYWITFKHFAEQLKDLEKVLKAKYKDVDMDKSKKIEKEFRL